LSEPQHKNNDEDGLSQKMDNLNLLVSAVRATIGKLEKDVTNVKKSVRTFNGARHNQPHFALIPSRDDALSGENACTVNDPNTESGVRKLKKNFFAFCEMESDDGGWIVIQNRFDGSINFFRGWDEYKEGFGNIAGEFWMGLEKIHELTSTKLYELLIVMEDFNDTKKIAKYSAFGISGESSSYTLNILGQFSGDADDSLTYHAGMKFSTFE
jgi:hypothetical protein